ncbi:MAG TPA: hypothetical protein EYG83_00535 [Sulfurospirillum arcachonense]|nr:hypothetical protein [Sulfurospirillum arcachonense]
MQNKNAKYIALKQAVAFSIDLSIVSLPLIIAPSLEILPFFALIWYLYIPLSEYYFFKTIGMKVVGTKIVCANDMQSHIALGTAFRRQIARISMMWGIIGWLFLFAGKQYVSDYVVIDNRYSSIDTKQDGWIKIHKENEYKVIFFVLLLMILFSMGKELL